jgi:hypothetical protein
MFKIARNLSLSPSPASALAVGALLGWLAREMSSKPEQPLFNLVTGLILLGSGCASYVLFGLHLQLQSSAASRGTLLAEARTCVTWLGCGVLLGMQALPLLLA